MTISKLKVDFWVRITVCALKRPFLAFSFSRLPFIYRVTYGTLFRFAFISNWVIMCPLNETIENSPTELIVHENGNDTFNIVYDIKILSRDD